MGEAGLDLKLVSGNETRPEEGVGEQGRTQSAREEGGEDGLDLKCWGEGRNRVRPKVWQGAGLDPKLQEVVGGRTGSDEEWGGGEWGGM